MITGHKPLVAVFKKDIGKLSYGLQRILLFIHQYKDSVEGRSTTIHRRLAIQTQPWYKQKWRTTRDEHKHELQYKHDMLCCVIGLLCNNRDVVAYTALLAAWLEVCFWIYILQTSCATYGYGKQLPNKLANLWAMLILIIMLGPIGHQYYTHV